MFRPLHVTLALTASATLLGGCAGINELTDGELINPSFVTAQNTSAGPQFISPGPSAQVQMSQQSAGNMVSSQSQTSVRASGTVATMAAASPNDPINAPPPPINLDGASSQNMATNTPPLRPMMLVPPPGTDGLQNDSPQDQTIDSYAGQVDEVTQLDQVISNDGLVREFTPASVMPLQLDQETTVISSDNTPVQLRQREFIPASVSQTGMVSTPVQPGDVPLSRGQLNSIQRFEILDRLLKEGLITPQEYNLRRSENLGALLPFTSDKPAAGLEREVPSGEAISSRLTALRRSIELRAITPRQHSIERNMILDALLPRNPIARESTMPPPSDVIEAAATVGHLERLRMAGLISDQEFENERAAIDQYLVTGSLMSSSDMGAQTDADPDTEDSQEMVRAQGPQMGLHLASYRTEAAAQSGWNNLNSKFASELQGLSPVIRRVNLGEARGTFYRLLAAPIPSSDRANSLCQQLKRSDQYCDPLQIGG